MINQVLILVLLDDGLGLQIDLWATYDRFVLILVLLDDGLGPTTNIGEQRNVPTVLILVLLDDGLGRAWSQQAVVNVLCLNPCSIGWWSWTPWRGLLQYLLPRLNPCSIGWWSWTQQQQKNQLPSRRVLILVLLDDGLGHEQEMVYLNIRLVLILVLLDDGLGHNQTAPIYI